MTSLQCKAIQLNNFSPQENVTQPQHPPIAPHYTTTVFYEFFCQDVKVGLSCWYVIELKTLYVVFPISHIFFCFILNILFFEDNIVSNNIILFIYLFICLFIFWQIYPTRSGLNSRRLSLEAPDKYRARHPAKKRNFKSINDDYCRHLIKPLTINGRRFETRPRHNREC